MKTILTFLVCIATSQLALSQTVDPITPVTIHGEGSQIFYIVNTNGYYQIQSSEIWLYSNGSEAYLSPVYAQVAAPQDQNGTNFPTGYITCAAGKQMAANSMGGKAFCGPTKVTTVGTVSTYSCMNIGGNLCKLETFNSNNVPITIWGWEFD